MTIMALALYSNIFSQKHTISGYVKDENTKEPIPFANVWIKGTYKGIPTDMDGYFSLDVTIGGTICISSVGYTSTEVIVQKPDDKMIYVFLRENIHSLQDVIVKPKIDYGKELFKKIIKSKKQNRSEISSTHNYKNITTTTIYLAIDTASGIKRFINNLDEVTIVTDHQNVRFSPIYLSEEANNIVEGKPNMVYSKKDGIFPKLNQTIESIILQYLVVDLDFYRNQIYIFDRGIVSPISDNALMYYNIYFNDSTFVDSCKFYNFSFSPKNKFAPLFTGNFSVSSNNFSLSNIEVYFQKEANINFVNGLRGKVTYKKQSDGKLFISQQQLGINLSILSGKDTAAVYGSQRLDEISNGNWLLNKTTYYSTSEKLDNIKARDWSHQEEFKLEEVNSNEYQRVDKLKNQPVIKTIDAIGGAVLTSYINCGSLDIGPVFDIYSTNAIEGNRFTVPLRTGEKVFEHFTIGGLVGYGTKNNEFKYGANIGWQPFKNDKYVVRLSYTDDYSLISQDKFLRFIKKNPNTRGNGNFIAAITTRERDPYLKEERSIELRFEYNADKNFDMEISPYFAQNNSTATVRFVNNGIDNKSYQNYGVLINCRLAFGQYFDKLYFARVYYLTQTPVVNLSVDIGHVNLTLNGADDLGLYSHFHGSIQGMYNLGQIAMRYMVNGGYLLGEAPYDLLDIPVGSMSLGYAKYRYNLLHQAAFAHNLYTNAHLEFSGGGLFLNHIPGVRKLKLREMFSVKCHYGTINNVYKGVFELPEYYDNKLTYPYTEMGIGLTNIFKVLRVEYVRQVGDYHTKENLADKRGVRFRAELSF